MSTKRNKEAWIFELFKDHLPDGPITELAHIDAPDFCFSLANKRIGLEVTELYHDTFAELPKSMQKSSFGAEFTEDVIKLLSPRINHTFGIGIVFNDFYPVSSANRNRVLIAVTKTCASALQTLDNKQSLELGYLDNLPEQIHHIRLLRYDHLESSFDFRPEGGTIPNLDRHGLLKIIRGKENKIREQEEFEEMWLLIREGNYFAGSFTIDELDIPFESKFDRIYLLSTSGEVKVIRIG